jgi:hypothetical protein
MTKNRFLYSSFLVLVSLWWGWTFLVDMIIIRTAFGLIDNFFQAGDLGVAIFSKLNNLEVVAGSFLVVVLSLNTKRNRRALPILIMSVITWLIGMTYLSYLTPKLIELTDLWRQTDLMGLTSVAGIPDVQQEHQFYHNLYIGLDSVKLVLLSIMLGLGIWKEEKMF